MATRILSRLKNHGHSIAIVNQSGEPYTYNDLNTISSCVREGILKSSTKKNTDSRVAILCNPGVEFVSAQIGAWRSGYGTVPLCITHPKKELLYYIEDSKPQAIISDEAHMVMANELSKDTKIPIISTELAMKSSSTSVNDDSPLSDESHVIYTSGTTGRPKGVITTNEGLESQVSDIISAWEITKDDRILHFLPLHHVHGLVNKLFSFLAVGASVEFSTPEPKRLWQRISHGAVLSEPITVFMAVPTVYSKMIHYYDEEMSHDRVRNRASQGARNLRLMISGSAALQESVFKRWQEITGHRLLERYGMTETGMILGNPLSPMEKRLPGYVGKPFQSVSVRLMKPENENELVTASNEPGLLQVKGKSVFKEYLGKPEATKKEFTSDGYFKTGDVALYDDKMDSFKILGRASVDIIKSSGYKISALDVERELLDHPNIREVAVFGTQDPTYGERVTAMIVLKPGSNVSTLSVQDLREFCKNRMPTYKIPSLVRIVQELPKNAMGKVSKKDLAKQML